MYRFHVNLFAAPPGVSFDCSWEDAAAKLERLPRMIFEPDGSFVVSGDGDGLRWQVDGHLFDFDDRLQRMELRGQCPPTAFDELLRCVGWPGQPLRFEMVREGVMFDECQFRRYVEDG